MYTLQYRYLIKDIETGLYYNISQNVQSWIKNPTEADFSYSEDEVYAKIEDDNSNFFNDKYFVIECIVTQMN